MLEGVPSVHYTMDEVSIDEYAEVLNTEGDVTLGLCAAWEVTGGIHGENRLGAVPFHMHWSMGALKVAIHL